ncbi:hypothetical protein BU16DRAFT_564321 [Lophium mytilinum]|uniref:Uncharacterized protein n=1 Tax=Lophium mytilinum TaxID=390894 RepID=A0A6A6QM19_9PEZI|nr:hypothetical protein BU16DRAFT_564321 [Lophium mytilinum]
MSDALSLHLSILYTATLRLRPQIRLRSKPQQPSPPSPTPASPSRGLEAQHTPRRKPPKKLFPRGSSKMAPPPPPPPPPPPLYTAPPLHSPAIVSRTVVHQHHLRCPRCATTTLSLTLTAPGQDALGQRQCARCIADWAGAGEGFCAFPALLVRPGSSGSGGSVEVLRPIRKGVFVRGREKAVGRLEGARGRAGR